MSIALRDWHVQHMCVLTPNNNLHKNQYVMGPRPAFHPHSLDVPLDRSAPRYIDQRQRCVCCTPARVLMLTPPCCQHPRPPNYKLISQSSRLEALHTNPLSRHPTPSLPALNSKNSPPCLPNACMQHEPVQPVCIWQAGGGDRRGLWGDIHLRHLCAG